MIKLCARLSGFLATLAIVAFPLLAQALGTAGSDVGAVGIALPDSLDSVEWTTQILEYDAVSGPGFRLRIDFHFVNFVGALGERSLTTAIQNIFHTFQDDTVQIPLSTPGLNLYWSSLLPSLADGVELLADPLMPPNFGRVFENIDGYGNIGNNIYNRVSLGQPTSAAPIVVHWTVRRIGIATNPPQPLTRDLTGQWLTLQGTYVKWLCQASIDGVTYNVALYYLPIEYCEFISPTRPLALDQEHFEDPDGSLLSQRTHVLYEDMQVSAGSTVYPLEEWTIFRRIDDEQGNLHNDFGWYSNAQGLHSVSGDPLYASTAFRDPGKTFFLGSATGCQGPDIPALCDIDCNQNGIADACEIIPGVNDCNGDGFLDECEIGGPNPLFSLGEAFCQIPGNLGLDYESYPDDRPGGTLGTGGGTPGAMTYTGWSKLASGTMEFTGPTFQNVTTFYPYVQGIANLGGVIVHPGSDASSAGASISFTARSSGFFRFVGDFARANDYQFAGNGVTVMVVQDRNTEAPLFASTVPSDLPVDPNALFASGVHFDCSDSLAAGTKVRFLVFPGQPGNLDIGFDATAIRFSVYTDLDGSGNGKPDGCSLSGVPRYYGNGLAVINAHNFPNPFNPLTRIEFRVLHGGESSGVKVIDSRGLVVWQKDLGILNTGVHSVDWPGVNDRGQTVSSGVYFFQIKVGHSFTGGKLTLLK